MNAPLPVEAVSEPGWRSGLLALVAGIAHAASFAPWPMAWLQLAALALLLLLWLPSLASGPASLASRRVWLLPALFAVGWFAAGLCWLYVSMHFYGGMPAPMAAAAVGLMAAGLSLFPVAAFIVTAALTHQKSDHRSRPILPTALVFASAWGLTEWLRGWLFTGFPWIAIGYAHVDSPLSGWAPVLGVYGVCALAAMLAYLMAEVVIRYRHAGGGGIKAPAAGAAIILASGWLLSMIVWSSPTGEPLRVRLVQGNVPQQLKFDPRQTLKAMQQYAQVVAAREENPPVQLVVLPETAWTLPWSMTDPAVIEAMFPAHLRSTDKRLVAIGMPLPVSPGSGGPSVASAGYGPGSIANSVLLLRADQPTQAGARYDKRHLVPFGEFVPWGFEWFVQLMHIPLGSFARGAADQAPFQIGDQRVAFNICYEDLFGEELAASVRADGGAASVLVNVSNIGWFGHSHALGQHLEIARMRSIELARPMLRSTNTGVTAAIDARGNVQARLANHTIGHLDVAVQGMQGDTPFVRWTHAPFLLIAAAVLFAAAWRRRYPAAGYN